jgi:hypothetical protein
MGGPLVGSGNSYMRGVPAERNVEACGGNITVLARSSQKTLRIGKDMNGVGWFEIGERSGGEDFFSLQHISS